MNWDECGALYLLQDFGVVIWTSSGQWCLDGSRVPAAQARMFQIISQGLKGPIRLRASENALVLVDKGAVSSTVSIRLAARQIVQPTKWLGIHVGLFQRLISSPWTLSLLISGRNPSAIRSPILRGPRLVQSKAVHHGEETPSVSRPGTRVYAYTGT